MKDWLKLRESLREKKDSEICSNANNPYAETHQLDKKYFENMIKDILGDDYEKLVTTHGILEKCSTDNMSLEYLYSN